MSLIKALIHPVTPFQQNAPILYCEESKKCAFIDPGGDIDILLGAAKENNLIVEYEPAEAGSARDEEEGYLAILKKK